MVQINIELVSLLPIKENCDEISNIVVAIKSVTQIHHAYSIDFTHHLQCICNCLHCVSSPTHQLAPLYHCSIKKPQSYTRRLRDIGHTSMLEVSINLVSCLHPPPVMCTHSTSTRQYSGVGRQDQTSCNDGILRGKFLFCIITV